MSVLQKKFLIFVTRNQIKDANLTNVFSLDRTMWRARFGRGFGNVVRQTTK